MLNSISHFIVAIVEQYDIAGKIQITPIFSIVCDVRIATVHWIPRVAFTLCSNKVRLHSLKDILSVILIKMHSKVLQKKNRSEVQIKV